MVGDNKTPAQIELGERRTELYGEPIHRVAGMPQPNMESSVVTDNPMRTLPVSLTLVNSILFWGR